MTRLEAVEAEANQPPVKPWSKERQLKQAVRDLVRIIAANIEEEA